MIPLLAWSLLATGPALAADAVESAAVAVVLDRDGAPSLAGTDRTVSAVVKELKRRGFTAASVDGDALLASAKSGATAARLTEEESLATGDLVILVETEAQFYAQVAGRYRWTVHADITVAPRTGGGEPLVRSIEVPVFLVYDHEREAEALAESSAMLARKVGAVARDYRDGER